MRFLDNLTVELSCRSVARALPNLLRAWHAFRSALVICSAIIFSFLPTMTLYKLSRYFFHSDLTMFPVPNCWWSSSELLMIYKILNFEIPRSSPWIGRQTRFNGWVHAQFGLQARTKNGRHSTWCAFCQFERINWLFQRSSLISGWQSTWRFQCKMRDKLNWRMYFCWLLHIVKNVF